MRHNLNPLQYQKSVDMSEVNMSAHYIVQMRDYERNLVFPGQDLQYSVYANKYA